MRRAILLLSVSLGIASGNGNDTSTGIDLDRLPHFPLAKVRSGWLKSGERVTFDGISAIAEHGEVLLSGVAKSGRRWEVHISGIDEVWRADLDGNGTLDYVFTFDRYPDGRIAPQFSLSVLLMDSDGMPVPFFTRGHQAEDGDAIKHLLDLNQEGKAELLISDFDDDPSDAFVGYYCSGHWINQLYGFNNLGAQEIRGAEGGIRFPLIQNWTYRGTKCAPFLKPFFTIRSPKPLNHETGGKVLVATIRDAQVGGVTIEPAGGCQGEIVPSYVVYDTPRLRRIAFTNPGNLYLPELVRTIRTGRRVELRGVNKQQPGGSCSADLLWVK